MAVFAQVAPIDIAQMVTQFSSVGFAVWFAYYTVTKLVPDLVKDFRSDIKEKRESFLKHLDLLSSTFGSVADASKENVNATKTLDSHVVRIHRELATANDEIRIFRLVWKRYARFLRDKIEDPEDSKKLEEHLFAIDSILDDVTTSEERP